MTQSSFTAPTSIKLDANSKCRMQRLAATRQRSAHSMMVEAIQQYLEREEQLEQFRNEMEAVWQDYQLTGKTVSATEVVTWMESWFTDDERPMPSCQH